MKASYLTLRTIIILTLSIGVLFIPNSATSQVSIAQFKHLTVEDGLAQGTVLDMLQDKNGLIWIATASGLSLYDGYKFTSYTKESDSPQRSLSDNYVRTLLERDDNSAGHQIWIGTDGAGVDLLDYNKNHLSNLNNNPFTAESLPGNNVTALYADPHQNIWVGIRDEGVIKIDAVTRQHTRYLVNKEGLGNIRSIIMDNLGQLWVGTTEKGLYVLKNASNTETEPYFTRVSEIPFDGITAIEIDDSSHFWIASFGGLIYYNFAEHRIEKIYRPEAGNPNSLVVDRLLSLVKDRRGYLWIGTTRGLTMYNPATGVFINHSHMPGISFSLPDDRVLSLMEDRDGTIWVGTNKGISLLNEPEPYFRMLIQEPRNPNSLSHNRIKAIYEDTLRNGLWVGSFGGGLDFFDHKTGNVTHYKHDPTDDTSISLNAVFALHQSKNEPGFLWIGTFGRGIDKLNIKTGVFRHYSNDPSDSTSLQDDNVYDIAEDDRGNLWIATGGGLSRYDPESDGFVQYYQTEITEDGSIRKKKTTIVTLEPDGTNLWIGTFGEGVQRYDTRFNKTEIFQHHDDSLSSLSHNRVKDIVKDTDGNIWIGTAGGLDRFDPETNTFIHHQDLIQVSDGKVIGILEGSLSGEMWLSTNHGLIYYNTDTQVVKKFSASDGLPGNEYNRGAKYRSNSGRLYFGGVDGVTSFDPQTLPATSTLPDSTLRICFTGLKADGEIMHENSLMIAADPVARFSPELGSFTLTFTPTNYIYQKKIQYQYRIKEFQNAWISLGNDNKVAIAPPRDIYGVFHLELQASFDGDFINADTKIATFYQEPFLFQPWWIRAFFGLLTVMGLTKWYQGRAKTESEKQAWLRLQVARRTKQYTEQNNVLRTEIQERKAAEEALKIASIEVEKAAEVKSTFLANMSHEIRTPLNGIIGMVSLLKDTPLDEVQTDHVETLDSSSNFLMHLLNDILDFSKIEAGQLTLEKVSFELEACIEETLGLMSGRAGESGIELLYFIDGKLPTNVIGDLVRYRQILSNLISNAIKFTHEGQVVVTVSSEKMTDSSFRLVTKVQDSGIGIDNQSARTLFNQFSQADTSTTRKFGGTGLGLAICKKLCDLLGGEIKAEGKLGEGATFTFELPFNLADKTSRIEIPQLYFDNKKVLILESHSQVYDQLITFCQNKRMQAYSPGPTETVEDLLVREPHFDVVILDKKSHLAYHNLFENIQAKIILSPLGMATTPPAGYKLLKRPVNPNRLFAIIEGLLNISQQQNRIIQNEKDNQHDRDIRRRELQILLAEDNAINRKVVCYLLDRAGYSTVDIAENGLEAYGAVQKKAYDIILMDMHMPVMDGLEATEKIRNYFSDKQVGDPVKIIALTASTMEEDKRRCFDAGMNAFLSKPIEKSALLKMLDENL